jgi:hypothetical protein
VLRYPVLLQLIAKGFTLRLEEIDTAVKTLGFGVDNDEDMTDDFVENAWRD